MEGPFDEFTNRIIRQQQEEWQRQADVRDKIKAIYEAPATFKMFALLLGEHDGLPFIRNGQFKSICQSGELNELYQTAMSIIDAVDAIAEKYTDEEYDAMISEGERLYEEQSRELERFNRTPKEPKPPKQTSIYIMLNEHTGHYKIGRSANPNTRERTLQSQEPSVKLLVSYPGTYKDEKTLHQLFAHKRIRGEWFILDAEDLEAAIRLLKRIDK